MNRLDKAIADFEDETLDLSLGERISKLRDALSWAAFERLKTIQEYGSKSPESAEMEFKQTECMKQFKIIESMYTSELKQNKLLGKAQEAGMSSKEFLQRIKAEKSSMGDIVRSLKPSEN